MSEQIIVERATYSDRLATDLGQLSVFLSDGATGDAVEEKLRMNTESPTIEQLVAYKGDQLVGAATLTQIGGIMPINKAWLEDFVVHADVRGQGVADTIADEWEAWSRERDISMLLFTSGWARTAAHAFYLRRGAKILNDNNDVTAFFNYPIPKERN